MSRLTFTYSIAIGEEEHSARVTGTFWPGCRGNIVEPPEDPSFEVASVEIPIAISRFGKPTGEFRHLDIVDVLTEAQVSDIAEHGVMAAYEETIRAQEQRAEFRRDLQLTD